MQTPSHAVLQSLSFRPHRADEGMSGFITTMFVPSPSSFPPSFPAKPEPLRPVFTYAQSQSCMSLHLDMDTLDYLPPESRSTKDGIRCALELARPKETYQSPLQKIGRALRSPQAGSDTQSVAQASTFQIHPAESLRTQSPIPEDTEYSYTLVPGGNISPTINKTVDNAAFGFGQDLDESSDTGSIICPETIEQTQAPRNKGYLGATGLLSSFFSNPRTRAPFKPQKANRGTSSWQLKQYAEATLGNGSLRKAVKLPEGEDKDEWLAVNGEHNHCPE
jgi:MOB kinase activator 1